MENINIVSTDATIALGHGVKKDLPDGVGQFFGVIEHHPLLHEIVLDTFWEKGATIDHGPENRTTAGLVDAHHVLLAILPSARDNFNEKFSG